MTVTLFLARRLAAVAVLLVVVSFLVFSLLTLSPGSAVSVLIGTRPVSPQLVHTIEAEYHLNDPFLVQYWHWLAGVVHLDFGQSISTAPDLSVLRLIGDRLSISVELAAYAMIIVLAVGIPAGMLAGIHRGRVADRTISTFAMLGFSAPAFAVGIVLLYIFGVELSWFPVYGEGSGTTERIQHLTLPAITFAVFLMAIIIRQTRAATLDVMQQDYITFARARGLKPTRIMIRYALRNTALPVVTASGILLIVALSATVIVENVFSLPGMGSLLLTSVTNKDIPVVQGLALVIAAFVITVNLIVDLLSLVIDPRGRYSASGRK